MESLFAFAAVIVALIPIAVIYLLISNAGLKRRIAALEVRALEPEVTTTDAPSQASPIKLSPSPTKVGPWAAAQKTPSPGLISATKSTPKATVFNAEKLQSLVTWVMQNWFYAVSAISLALAGIFLVIYGIEQGLLPPSVRIMASFVFGGALVGAGEFIRRRYGDGDDASTAYLPSTFSGAGIVTLFGAVLAARLLYDFIGPNVALIGMAAVGALALVLGWFYGPLLAAVGIIGAMVSPFIIGGSSDDPSFLLVYFAIVTVVGLAIDTIRRWAWVSVIALTLGFTAGLMLMLGSSWLVQPYFILYCTALALAAIAIPVRKLTPDHAGTPLSLSMFARTKGDLWPEFPTKLAGGAMIAASILIAIAAFGTQRADLFWIAVAALAGLVLALLVWARNAPALVDLTILPAAFLIAVIGAGGPIWQPLARAAQEPEADMPLIVTIVVALGLLLSGVAAWRSRHGGPTQLFVALGAAIMAPALAIAIEVFWHPAEVIGGYLWALHAMAIGAAMVVMAERFARIDGPDHRNRISFAALSALACVAFGVVILFSSAALTSAIALTIVAAAWLDRQFNLPLMGLYILAGITAVGYRLVVDPGVDWAIDAPLPAMLLSHGGAVVAFAVSYLFVKAAKRPRSEVLLESAVFSSTGILLSLLLYRTIIALSGEGATTTHWALGIGATVWITLGMAQLRRLEIGGALSQVRTALGMLFLVVGAAQILAVLTVLNPLFSDFNNLVLGPSLLNTLIPAYLVPAAAIALGAWWLRSLPKHFRIGFAGLASALVAVWFGLTIRHFWRGAAGMELPGIDQPELYSYTVALLIIGAGLFYQSLATQSALLRKAGLAVIGLAVAKVFLLDIRGLGGLIRVFSLLFLGLSLAGLAWLNRWAVTRSDTTEASENE